MTTPGPQYTQPGEPTVIVNIIQTEVDPETILLPYPPRPSKRRRISESIGHTDNLLKRRRGSDPTHSRPVNCPCLPPPAYEDVIMSEPSSDDRSASFASIPNHSTPPTSGSEPHRRPSHFAEVMEKFHGKVKNVFGRGRDPAEGVMAPPSSPTKARRSSDSMRECELQANFAELALTGGAYLPNVSLFFDVHGEAGPSSFYHTADWDKFQEGQDRRHCHDQAMDLDPQDHSPLHITQSNEFEQVPKKKRRDSHFSLSGILSKSRRSSKDKGKGRQLSEDVSQNAPLEITSECASHSPTDLGLLPRTSTDRDSLLVSKEPENIPEAEFSSSKSSIPSMEFANPQYTGTNRILTMRAVTPPPPSRPEVRPASSVGSSTSSTSLSSMDSSTPMLQESSAGSNTAITTVAASSSTYRTIRHTSPTLHHQPTNHYTKMRTHTNFSLPTKHTRNDPSSTSTRNPPISQSTSDSNSGRISHISVDPSPQSETQPAPPSTEDTKAKITPSLLHQEDDDDDDDIDIADFSVTHITRVKPGSVRRSMRASGDLRGKYVRGKEGDKVL